MKRIHLDEAEQIILSSGFGGGAAATDRHNQVIRSGMEGTWPAGAWERFNRAADVWDAAHFEPCADPDCIYFRCSVSPDEER